MTGSRNPTCIASRSTAWPISAGSRRRPPATRCWRPTRRSTVDARPVRLGVAQRAGPGGRRRPRPRLRRQPGRDLCPERRLPCPAQAAGFGLGPGPVRLCRRLLRRRAQLPRRLPRHARHRRQLCRQRRARLGRGRAGRAAGAHGAPDPARHGAVASGPAGLGRPAHASASAASPSTTRSSPTAPPSRSSRATLWRPTIWWSSCAECRRHPCRSPPDALRLSPDELDARARPAGASCFCCASGIRAHRAARLLAERGVRDVAVLALSLG